MKLRSIKNKKGQGIMGVPFSMIFSIILIVFFMAGAFVAIKFFLGFNRKAQIGLFLEDLQSEIDEAWISQSSSFVYEGSLPSGVESVCFINMTGDIKDADLLEHDVYDRIKFSGVSYDVNFVLWPVESASDIGFKTFDHFKFPDSNPYCLLVEGGKVDIKIEKEFGDALPRVSAG